MVLRQILGSEYFYFAMLYTDSNVSKYSSSYRQTHFSSLGFLFAFIYTLSLLQHKTAQFFYYNKTTKLHFKLLYLKYIKVCILKTEKRNLLPMSDSDILSI